MKKLNPRLKKEVDQILDSEEKKDRRGKILCSRHSLMLAALGSLRPELQSLVLETTNNYRGPGMVENLSKLAGLSKIELEFNIDKLETWNEKAQADLFKPYISKNGWGIPVKLTFLYEVQKTRAALWEKEQKGADGQ